MKVRSGAPLPLGPDDVLSKEEAEKMVGQKTQTKFDGRDIGVSTIVEVDWRGPNDVWITMENEIHDLDVIEAMINGLF